MDTLPTEISSLIAAGLATKDLFNFRLVNKRINWQILSYFLKRYFEERYVLFSKHSLENLQQITCDPVFGPSVHRLILTPHHLSTAHVSNLESPKSILVNRQSYEDLLDEQRYLLSSGFITACLALALSRATNCRTVVVADDWDDQAWGLSSLKKRIGIPPTTGFEGQESLDLLNQMIQTVLAAMAASGARLQEFELNLGLADSPPQPGMLQQPESFLCGANFTSTLHSLHLLLGPPTEENADTWASDLGQFIMNFSKLEQLSLAFHIRLEGQYVRELHENIYINTLRILEISSIDCGEEELAQMFAFHGDTLERITLDTVDLPTLESWKRLVGKIRSDLSLSLLTLSNCAVSDSHYLIVPNQTCSHDNDHTITMRNGTEMDLAVKSMTLRDMRDITPI
jgi:hypothetical protein